MKQIEIERVSTASDPLLFILVGLCCGRSSRRLSFSKRMNGRTELGRLTTGLLRLLLVDEWNADDYFWPFGVRRQTDSISQPAP